MIFNPAICLLLLIAPAGASEKGHNDIDDEYDANLDPSDEIEADTVRPLRYYKYPQEKRSVFVGDWTSEKAGDLDVDTVRPYYKYPVEERPVSNGDWMPEMGGKRFTEKIENFHPVVIELRKDTFCGGTMIDNQYILTAAHCFFHPETVCRKNFDIRLWRNVIYKKKGMFVIHEDGNCIGCKEPGYKETQRYTDLVKDVIIPRLYVRSRCHRGDIAIVRLRRPIGKPLKVYISGNEKIPSTGKFSVAGFGFDPDYPSSDVRYLNKLDVRVSKCPAPLGKKKAKEVLCVEEKVTAVCKGDSGSALVERNRNTVYLHGVVAHGTDCKLLHAMLMQKKAGVEVDRKMDHSGYFTRTSAFITFICAATEWRVGIVGENRCDKAQKPKMLVI